MGSQPGQDEDPRPDDRTHAERCELHGPQRALQAVLTRFSCFPREQVDALRCKEWIAHPLPPFQRTLACELPFTRNLAPCPLFTPPASRRIPSRRSTAASPPYTARRRQPASARRSAAATSR